MKEVVDEMKNGVFRLYGRMERTDVDKVTKRVYFNDRSERAVNLNDHDEWKRFCITQSAV